MSLDEALTAAHAQVPECVAMGYLDLSTGTLLGVRTTGSHPRDALDVMSSATVDLLLGTNVAAVTEAQQERVGARAADRGFQEVVVFSADHIHVFLRGRRNPSHAMIAVCRGHAKVGAVIARSRVALSSLEIVL